MSDCMHTIATETRSRVTSRGFIFLFFFPFFSFEFLFSFWIIVARYSCSIESGVFTTRLNGINKCIRRHFTVYEAGPPSFHLNSLLVNSNLFYVQEQFRIVDYFNSKNEREKNKTAHFHRVVTFSYVVASRHVRTALEKSKIHIFVII